MSMELEIGDGGALEIVEAIKINSTLQEISLESNGIGDDGALVFAQMLKLNSSLQGINLSYNLIGVEGTRAFIEAMEFNSSLQEIHFSDNESGVKLQLIYQALEGCRNRRKRNARLWMCSFIDHWREQRLNFDNHIFAFYFYPLLGIELS